MRSSNSTTTSTKCNFKQTNEKTKEQTNYSHFIFVTIIKIIPFKKLSISKWTPPICLYIDMATISYKVQINIVPTVININFGLNILHEFRIWNFTRCIYEWL